MVRNLDHFITELRSQSQGHGLPKFCCRKPCASPTIGCNEIRELVRKLSAANMRNPG